MKLLGVGNTASVYEVEDNKALKLFHEGYDKELVEKEYQNALRINECDFSKPKAYEMVHYDNKYGIIYDKVDGISLEQWVLENKEIEQCAGYMALAHKEILSCEIDNVPDYKDFLRYFLVEATKDDKSNQIKVLQLLDSLPEGNTLCHGDFHPGNIFISDQKISVIDFMNVCHGSRYYDIARTVYLVEYTPVADNMPEPERLIKLKRELMDEYLIKMDTTREEIKDYLYLIQIARRAECPGEFVN